MKTLFITLLLAILTVTAFAQQPSYGPVPYRTLKETIGETYMVLHLNTLSLKSGYSYLKKDDNSFGEYIKTDIVGVKLKLVSIDDRNGHFVDSTGQKYICSLSKGVFNDLVLNNDFIEARKLFLNKKLWLNSERIGTGALFSYDRLEGVRFDAVTVVDIVPNEIGARPLVFILKTASGQIGYSSVSISGTNNSHENPKDFFPSVFFTEDPKLTYHFTPAVWQMVKAGFTEIGMPIDAFRLVRGFPKTINTTQTAKGTTVQWVYGTDHQSYYYFTNGKLTAKQD